MIWQLQLSFPSGDGEQKMDLISLPLITTATLRPPLQLFLDQLTGEQWVKLESGSVDRNTESNLADTCERLIRIISSQIYGAVQKGSVTKHEVHECLGDCVPLSLGEVTNVASSIFCQDSRELTALMVEAVMERVNLKLFNGGGSGDGCNLLTCRDLNTIVKRVEKLLKHFTARMASRYEGPPNTESDERKREPASPAEEETMTALVEGPSVTEGQASKPPTEEGPDSTSTTKEAVLPVSGESAVRDKGETETGAHKDQELDKLCETIVTRLAVRILKDVPGHVSIHLITSIMTLKERLYDEVAHSDVGVELSGRHIEKLVKVVYKDLCQRRDSPEMVLQTLQDQKPCFYEDVTESLKRHLVTLQKKSQVRFVRPARWMYKVSFPKLRYAFIVVAHFLMFPVLSLASVVSLFTPHSYLPLRLV